MSDHQPFPPTTRKARRFRVTGFQGKGVGDALFTLSWIAEDGSHAEMLVSPSVWHTMPAWKEAEYAEVMSRPVKRQNGMRVSRPAAKQPKTTDTGFRDVDDIPVEPFGRCDPKVARAPYPGSVRVIDRAAAALASEPEVPPAKGPAK